MAERLSELETVIGLEVHAELNTASKIFCGCSTAFGAAPNTQCCPICAGLPGAHPVLNRRAVEKTVMAGLALHCEISSVSRMDRKQYVYPDLPKAYQISQNEYPLCKNGYLDIQTAHGSKRIGITRIHLEEDAGKLLHTADSVLIDYNRCGVGLIEIVSQPDLRSAEEAVVYLRELREILMACGVSDCRMQEGSFRCDVNLSIRPKGSAQMGTRTEIKNLNSFSLMEKAIAAEILRQAHELEENGKVLQRTVRFAADTGKTEPMRIKETAADYRFFPEPNLPPIRIHEEDLERLRSALPELPAQRRQRLESMYGISTEDARVLTGTVGLAEYYEECAANSRFPVLVCNLLLNELLRYWDGEGFSAPISPCRIGKLADLLGDWKISFSTGKRLLERLVRSDFSPETVAMEENLMQINDEKVIGEWVMEILMENAKAVEDYRRGRNHAKKSLIGSLMAKSRGRANPVLAERLLTDLLEEKQEG